MTTATAGVIKFLSGELDAAQDKEAKTCVVEEQCKPMIRSLVGQYDAEDDKTRREEEAEAAAHAAAQAAKETKAAAEKALKDYDAGFGQLIATFSRMELMHGLASKFLIHQHYWKVFIPIQIIVMLAALLAFFAAALDSQKNVQIAFWLSLAAGALGFVAALLNAIDRYLDWKTQGELHKKAAAVYGRARTRLNFGSVATRTNDGEDAGKLPLADFQKQLQNLNEAIGELQIPYQIVQAFDYVEQMIHEQIQVMNLYYYQNVSQTPYPLWTSPKENNFLLAAYTVVANEFTDHRSGCCTSWLWMLPDPKVLAVRAHKKVQEQLFEVRFRDEPATLRAMQINYDQFLGASRMAPAPTTAADIEAPADPAARE